MTIYEHKDTITAAAGSTSTTTLKVRGGLLRSIFVKANTSTTVFRLNLTDENGDVRLDYGFSTGMLNENDIAFPIVNTYIVNITNASPNDTFKVKLGIQE